MVLALFATHQYRVVYNVETDKIHLYAQYIEKIQRVINIGPIFCNTKTTKL